jgi:hypothetical protein
VSEGWPHRRVADPDGREVVFDVGSHLHLVRRMRSELLDQVDEILAAVAAPDFREDDPVPGRERFYRQNFIGAGRWLRVVVDFNVVPAWVVTAFVGDRDPRIGQR